MVGISHWKKGVLIGLNIVVGIWVSAVVLTTSVLLSLNARRPIGEQEEPVIDLSPYFEPVIHSGWVMIFMISFVLLVTAGAVWAHLKHGAKQEHSLLVFFPAYGIGFKFVLPVVLIFFAYHVSAWWAIGIAAVAFLSTTALLQAVLYAWSHSGGDNSAAFTIPEATPEDREPHGASLDRRSLMGA